MYLPYSDIPLSELKHENKRKEDQQGKLTECEFHFRGKKVHVSFWKISTEQMENIEKKIASSITGKNCFHLTGHMHL